MNESRPCSDCGECSDVTCPICRQRLCNDCRFEHSCEEAVTQEIINHFLGAKVAPERKGAGK